MILVPGAEIEPYLLALPRWSLNHWTTTGVRTQLVTQNSGTSIFPGEQHPSSVRSKSALCAFCVPPISSKRLVLKGQNLISLIIFTASSGQPQMNLVMFCYQRVHSNSENDYCLDSCKGTKSFTLPWHYQCKWPVQSKGQIMSCVIMPRVLISWNL